MAKNDTFERVFSAETGSFSEKGAFPDGELSPEGQPGGEGGFIEDDVRVGEGPSPETDMENLTIEDAFAQLEMIVRRMEEEGISLEESFSCYERGVRLVRYCNAQIDRVEKKVRILQGENYDLE